MPPRTRTERLRAIIGAIAALTACAATAAEPAAERLTIVADEQDPRRITVRAEADDETAWANRPLDDRAAMQSLLSLRVASAPLDAATEPAPAILGRYSVDRRFLEFRPLVRLAPGSRYVARCGTLTTEYRVPLPDPSRAPHVTRIEPTGRTVPANHLKFYLQFSEPMSRGDVFRHLRLDNVTRGETVPDPFRETELWSADDRRFTLWLHPGRQKTGVNLNVELGPILRDGDDYRLVISREWTSQAGLPAKEDATHAFRAGPPDRTQPAIERWTLTPPRAGTRDPLRLRFGEALDASLVRSSIAIETANGERLAGVLEPIDAESACEFVPESPWPTEPCRIAVQTILEDLAGNSVARPFEVDLTSGEKTNAATVVHRTFSPRTGNAP